MRMALFSIMILLLAILSNSSGSPVGRFVEKFIIPALIGLSALNLASDWHEKRKNEQGK